MCLFDISFDVAGLTCVATENHLYGPNALCSDNFIIGTLFLLQILLNGPRSSSTCNWKCAFPRRLAAQMVGMWSPRVPKWYKYHLDLLPQTKPSQVLPLFQRISRDSGARFCCGYQTNGPSVVAPRWPSPRTLGSIRNSFCLYPSVSHLFWSCRTSVADMSWAGGRGACRNTCWVVAPALAMSAARGSILFSVDAFRLYLLYLFRKEWAKGHLWNYRRKSI